jgi:phosphomannomutase
MTATIPDGKRRGDASAGGSGRLSLSTIRADHAFRYRCAGSVMKKLVIFDLDGTLAESKASLDTEMATLLAWLLTCGTKFYRYDGAWQKLYSEDFSTAEKERIIRGLNKAIDQSGFRAVQHWGDSIEDRDSQITFSALGQEAPLDEKKKWDSNFKKREKTKEILKLLLPDFSIQLGGSTSIDVTRPGIDKGYGVRKLQETLGIAIEDMIFVGDAVFPGGNDYPAKQAGVVSIEVRDPHETKRVIELGSGNGRC